MVQSCSWSLHNQLAGGLSHKPRHWYCHARPAVIFPALQHHCHLASTKLYYLVIEAYVCDQLAWGCCTELILKRSGIKPTTQGRRSNHFTTSSIVPLFSFHLLVSTCFSHMICHSFCFFCLSIVIADFMLLLHKLKSWFLQSGEVRESRGVLRSQEKSWKVR